MDPHMPIPRNCLRTCMAPEHADSSKRRQSTPAFPSCPNGMTSAWRIGPAIGVRRVRAAAARRSSSARRYSSHQAGTWLAGCWMFSISIGAGKDDAAALAAALPPGAFVAIPSSVVHRHRFPSHFGKPDGALPLGRGASPVATEAAAAWRRTVRAELMGLGSRRLRGHLTGHLAVIHDSRLPTLALYCI